MQNKNKTTPNVPISGQFIVLNIYKSIYKGMTWLTF